MNQKQISLRTNYNLKLGCPHIIHIDVAPVNTIPESRLESTIIEIKTTDNSHPPEKYKLYDLARLKLKDIPDHYIALSHGIEKITFLNNLFSESKTITPETNMAIYFYKIFKE